VIRICTSHRTEALLEAFVENLTDERRRDGPFAPVRVVVPNRNMETYLRLGVCQRCGIAANLETTFLRKFLAAVAAGAIPGAQVVDGVYLEGHLLALLHDEALLARPVLAPVRGYLAAAGEERDAVDRRRCQLAAELARLFDEYASSRPDLLAAWSRGEDLPRGPAEAEPAAWQRALWRAIFGPEGRLRTRAGKEDVRRRSLQALWDEAMAKEPPPFAGQTLHVFGLSYMATAYHRMLASLAKQSEVRIYTLGPCREDFDPGSFAPKASPEDPYGLLQEAQPALRLWARPGRENLRLLAELDGAEVDARFDLDAGDRKTLLHRLQDDIVHRRVAEPGAANDALDGSLRVLPCPSLRRELEVAAAEIWALVRREPALRLCDIAVIVPEASKDLYLAQISAVFAESCDLPHNLSDLAAAGSHPVARSIELLLRLPFSGCSRKDLLPLLTHPCLLARFPEATPAAWRALASELGIVRGSDRRALDGTYVRRDLFTWDQGLRRLALGAFLDPPPEEDATPLSIAGESYLPGPAVASDDEASLGFGLLARSLLADARFASGRGRGEERPLREWLLFVRGLLTSYLVLDEEDEAGQAIVGRFLAALDDLADNGLGELPISFRIAAELALRALSSLPWSRGHTLASGVTVATLVPMRAIPFRAVFVLGLGQNVFPRPAQRPELDLRSLGREKGDVNHREQDLYMFLETLLSTRDHLVLSYVARDEVTGDELPPSPVLLELRTLLGDGYVGQAALARLFGDDKSTRPPLRRFDDSPERREVLPAAEGEHQAELLGQEEVALGSPARLSPSTPKDPRNTPSSLVIPLSALFHFLQDPLQGSARFRLRMAEDDDEALADVEDEPFDLDRLALAQLLRATMPEAILRAQGAPTWEVVLSAHARQGLALELAGRAPTGILREAAAQAERHLLRGWHGRLAELLTAAPADCRMIRLAPSLGTKPTRSGHLACHRAPGFALELAGAGDTGRLDIRIEGHAGLWASARGSLDTRLAFSVSRRIAQEKHSREELRAFLDYVAVTAAGEAEERRGLRSALFFPDGKGAGDLRVLGFAPLAKARALAYLEDLCRELLTGARDAEGAPTGVHPYLLPYEAVLASRHKGSPLLPEILALCAGDPEHRSTFSSVQGPVRSAPERYAPPAEAEARRMVEARFGLFFDLAGKEPT